MLGAAEARGEPPAVEAGGGAFQASDAKDCNSDILYLNQLTGWQVRWPQEWQQLGDANDGQLKLAIAHWSTAESALRSDLAELRRDSATRSAAPRAIVERVLLQVSALRERL